MRLFASINKLSIFSMICLTLLVPKTQAEEVSLENGMQPFIQELFQSELAFAQEQGELQVGLSINYLNADEFESSETAVSFEYGVTEKFEMVIFLPYRTLDFNDDNVHDGIGDIKIGTLYNFINNDNFVFSIMLEAGLTTGNENKKLGENNTEWEPSLLVATELGEAQLFFSLGGAFSKGEANTARWSAAIAFPLVSNTAVIELNGSRGGEKEDAFLTFGLVRNLSHNQQLQAAFSAGLIKDSPNYGGIVKWNVEF